jgi:hypothetical protein
MTYIPQDPNKELSVIDLCYAKGIISEHIFV